MNLPNRITFSRIIITFIFIPVLLMPGVVAKISALLLFTIAAMTDLYDGWIAKKRNQITDFGKLMDPIADKILVLAAFITFVELQLIDAWMVMIIILREVSITGLRVFALTKGKTLAAERAGKHKTVSQMVAILMILGFIILKEYFKNINFWNEVGENFYKAAIYITMLVTVCLTLISGISYLWKNRKLIIRS